MYSSFPTLASSDAAPFTHVGLSDLLMILAVLVAPFVAVHVQRRLDVERERRNRKARIFRTLMATRAARLSGDHVSALNLIDIEYFGTVSRSGKQLQSASDRRVVQKWREYLDSLDWNTEDEAELKSRRQISFVRLVDLLQEMGNNLGYNFDRVLLEKGIYTPEAHGEREEAELIIRAGLAKILGGKAALPIIPIYPDDVFEKQKQVQVELQKVLSGEHSLRVIIDKNLDSK
ncbi:MAG: hypothetical protein RBS39_08270 [Phycisphaerales bacterium]|jgi:hypothetical protein|nr:hypothetical protein [Phycisphaerales bacterium]